MFDVWTQGYSTGTVVSDAPADVRVTVLSCGMTSLPAKNSGTNVVWPKHLVSIRGLDLDLEVYFNKIYSLSSV